MSHLVVRLLQKVLEVQWTLTRSFATPPAQIQHFCEQTSHTIRPMEVTMLRTIVPVYQFTLHQTQ